MGAGVGVAGVWAEVVGCGVGVGFCIQETHCTLASGGGGGVLIIMHCRSLETISGMPSHPYNVGTAHVGFAPTSQGGGVRIWRRVW